MERSGRIAQWYGYAVCFVAIITFLLTAKNIIDATFDLSAPLRVERYGMGGSLASFEAYKRSRDDRMSQRPMTTATGPVSPPRTYSDAELRAIFEDERRDAIENVRFRATRSLVSNSLMIAIALILFVLHWRWLRRQVDVA
ncbi:MAG TPA: hypothetical protein VM939_08785 [Gemmatimonadaceae bacterium]|nr:hypothetical protein [Gemmatimonadaceae bacterium]